MANKALVTARLQSLRCSLANMAQAVDDHDLPQIERMLGAAERDLKWLERHIGVNK